MQVAQIAAARGASRVIRITVEVGPLCGIEPVLLANAFSVARAGSCAAAAVLAIEASVVRVCCLTCGASCEAKPNRLLCAACGGYRTRVIEGEELRLRRVELEAKDAPLARSA
jgi:hydrogenase nickel incorporation protein HypA/HybF